MQQEGMSGLEEDSGSPCADWLEYKNYAPIPRPWRDFYYSEARLLPIPAPATRPPSSSALVAFTEDIPELFLSFIIYRHLARPGPRAIVAISRVCKAWRYVSKDTGVWRCICLSSWGRNEPLSLLRAELQLFGSWRGMYMRRPRVRYDGFYCCKWVTVRKGVDEGTGIKEGETKDNRAYKPVHVIPAYRIIQYREDGVAACLTTTADICPPAMVVKTFAKAWKERDLQMNEAPSNKRVKKGGKPKASKGWSGIGCVETKNGTVTFADWVLAKGGKGQVSLSTTYVLPSHPKMRPLQVEVSLVLSSVKDVGSNDRLDVARHTAGALVWGSLTDPGRCSSLHGMCGADGEMGWVRDESEGSRFDVKTDNKVYSFVQMTGFSKAVERLDGWATKGGLCSAPQHSWEGGVPSSGGLWGGLSSFA